MYLRSGRSFVPNGVRSEAPTDVGLCRCIRRVSRAAERGAKSVCMYPPVGALKDSDPPFFPPVCTPCSAHLHKNLLSEGGCAWMGVKRPISYINEWSPPLTNPRGSSGLILFPLGAPFELSQPLPSEFGIFPRKGGGNPVT